MKKSLSTRLSFRILLIVNLLFLVMLGVAGYYSYLIIRGVSEQSMIHLCEAAVSEAETSLNSVESAVQSTADILASVGMASETVGRVSRGAVSRNPVVSSFYVASIRDDGAVGRVVCVHRDSRVGVICTDVFEGGAGFDTSSIPALRIPVETHRSCWTNPYISALGNRVVAFSVPLIDTLGRTVAVLSAEMLLSWFDEGLDTDYSDFALSTLVLCPDYSVIGAVDTSLVTKDGRLAVSDKRVAEMADRMLRREKKLAFYKIGDSPYVSAFAPLHNGWSLVVSMGQEGVVGLAQSMLVILAIIFVIGLVLAFVITFRLVRRITRPVTQLSQSALSMAKGNFAAQLPEIKSDDEVRQLRDAFSLMQDSLASYIRELKATTEANMRIESELSVARSIQAGLLRTDFPPNLYALLSPAKEVGGDLYDFGKIGDYLYVAVGDVSGKGVPASLLMASTRACFRFLTGPDLPLGQVMGRINRAMVDSNSDNMFVTLFIARINLCTGGMDYCNAGHDPILLIPPQGDPYFLKPKVNLAAGVVKDFVYESEYIDLAPDTRLVLYTDGVNEAERADGKQFGTERMLRWASALAAATDREAVESLFRAVRDFAGDAPQNDDITILSCSIPKQPIISQSDEETL